MLFDYQIEFVLVESIKKQNGILSGCLVVIQNLQSGPQVTNEKYSRDNKINEKLGRKQKRKVFE